jgi:hypothetical protein
VIGGIAAVVICIIGWIVYYRRRKTKESTTKQTLSPSIIPAYKGGGGGKDGGVSPGVPYNTYAVGGYGNDEDKGRRVSIAFGRHGNRNSWNGGGVRPGSPYNPAGENIGGQRTSSIVAPRVLTRSGSSTSSISSTSTAVADPHDQYDDGEGEGRFSLSVEEASPDRTASNHHRSSSYSSVTSRSFRADSLEEENVLKSRWSLDSRELASMGGSEINSDLPNPHDSGSVWRSSSGSSTASTRSAGLGTLFGKDSKINKQGARSGTDLATNGSVQDTIFSVPNTPGSASTASGGVGTATPGGRQSTTLAEPSSARSAFSVGSVGSDQLTPTQGDVVPMNTSVPKLGDPPPRSPPTTHIVPATPLSASIPGTDARSRTSISDSTRSRSPSPARNDRDKRQDDDDVSILRRSMAVDGVAISDWDDYPSHVNDNGVSEAGRSKTLKSVGEEGPSWRKRLENARNGTNGLGRSQSAVA